MLIAVAVVGVIALTRGRPYGRTSFAAIAVALSLFAAPHVWSYDFLVLALPWGAALALADALPEPRRAAAVGLAVVTASIIPWSFYALAFARGQENLSAIVPVAAAFAVATVIGLRSRSDPSALR